MDELNEIEQKDGFHWMKEEFVALEGELSKQIIESALEKLDLQWEKSVSLV